MRIFLRTFFVVLFSIITCFSSTLYASAITRTICASGCDYTTINNAFTSEGAHDVLYQVQNTYSPATESWPILFPSASSTLICANEVTITQSNPVGNSRIYLSTSSTVMNCSFGHASVATNGVGDQQNVQPSGVRIINNIFSTSATSSIELTNGATLFEIRGNTNVNFLSTRGTTTNGLIQDNSFFGRAPGQGGGLMFDIGTPTTSHVEILRNSFINQSADPGSSMRVVSLQGSDITFATNTIRYAIAHSVTGVNVSLFSSATGTVYIGGNFIEGPTNNSECNAIYISPSQNAPWSASYTIRQNTILFRGNCTAGFGIKATDNSYAGIMNASLNLRNNLIDNEMASVLSNAAIEINRVSSNTFTQTNDYNAAYRFDNVLKYVVDGSATTPEGSHSYSYRPFLKTGDADSSNDLETAPFSRYLDIDGNEDIGATSNSRRSTIAITRNSSIDYSSIDATTTRDIPDFIKTGDTISIGSGIYDGFNINSTVATSSLTINGAGAAVTFIHGRSNENAITFTNVSSSALSNLQTRYASSTGSTTYSVTRMNFSHGGSNYNDAIPGFGLASNSMLILTNGGCDVETMSTDGYNLTSVVGGASNNFDIILGDIGGAKETLLVRSDLYASNAALESACAMPIGLLVDYKIANAFTVSSGEYTYHADGSTSLIGGASTPAITRESSRYAGIKLAGTSNNLTISNVTSRENGYGIWLSGTSNNGNTLSESTLSANLAYDIRSLANTTNTLDNVSFTRTSSSVEGTGAILTKFKLRIRALRAATGTVTASPATVTATDASSAANALGATDGTGYTTYASLPAYTLTNSSLASTNGGYNPYTISSVTTNYSASSTQLSLASVDQSATLYLISSVAPSAPSGASVGSIGAASGTLSWTDNADDETSYSINLINISTGESFPGTSVSVASDTTSYEFTGLTPNHQYRARVQAIGPGGSSAYSTSAIFRTHATTPSAPTAESASRTAITIIINGNTNSTSTEYSLYNSTLSSYLDSTGAPSATAVWQTTTTWGTVTASGLSCGTTYAFQVDARNADLVVTATSTAGTANTSACPTTNSTGGGGGGISTPIVIGNFAVTPPTAPPPVPANISGEQINPSTSPSLPTPPTTLPTDRTRSLIQSDARSFGLTLNASETDEISTFVEYGADPLTVRLGSGERRALVRDLFDSLRTDQLDQNDLIRVASGQIPLARNLAQERIQLSRVRATFRTIYGRDPNFQNSNENLTWNTLMYRIRFPRDLNAERAGITNFRRLFNRTPQDPFQWATVRALGYIPSAQ